MAGPHVVVLLVVTFGALWLYSRAWMRTEIVSLLLLAALLLTFHFFPFVEGGRRLSENDIFTAFGHPALVAICSLMILARGLTMTGALEPAVRILARLWRYSTALGMLVTLLAAALASGFVNDTPVLVLMLPLLQGLALRGGLPAARTLMPVNFAILAGGMLTSIGTSTNLLVLSIATDLGMHPVGLFDFTSVAALSLLVAIPYLWLIAPRLLHDGTAAERPATRLYAARILLSPESTALLGRTVADLERIAGGRLPIVDLHRDGHSVPDYSAVTLAVGDELVLNATATALRDVAATFRVSLFDRRSMSGFVQSESSRVDEELVEVVVGTDSSLLDRALSLEQFAERHGVAVVGVRRDTSGLQGSGGSRADHPIAVGDMLLLQGPTDRFDALQSQSGILVLGGRFQLPRSPTAGRALMIMVVVIAVASFKLLPIHVAAFLGVLAMLLVGCVRFEGLGRALSLDVVLLVASSIALGRALVDTGAAEWIAGGVAAVIGGLPAGAQLAAIMGMAAVLTNLVSNSAAAAIGTPIAVAAAHSLGRPLEPYVLAVLFGANLSFATPMAYQTNLLVMNAAGYRFGDFLRVGLPLVLVMLVSLSWLLAQRYSL